MCIIFYTWEQYLVKQGCPLAPDILNKAATCSSLEMLAWLIEHGAALTVAAMEHAAAAGSVDVCKLLLTNGCEWGVTVSEVAVLHNQLAALQWLLQEGCPHSAEQLCFAVASKGLLEIMAFLDERELLT
jgi:hypothetical protein